MVYSRPGCHLCKVLLEELMVMVKDHVAVQIRNIDTRSDWQRRYGLRIPIVVFGDQEVCQYTLDKKAIGAIVTAEKRSFKTS